MKVKEVKFSYVDGKYNLGPYIDFISELEVVSCDYNNIIEAIQKKFLEYKEIKVMSFKRP